MSSIFFLTLALLLLFYWLAWTSSMLVKLATKGRSTQKLWMARTKFFVFAGLSLSLLIDLYIEFHPGEDFYLNEFTKVTLRTPPSSARVVAKSSSMYSLRGEYCAYSRIELSQTDFQSLSASLESDSRFVVGQTRHEAIVNGNLVVHIENKMLETEDQIEVRKEAGDLPEKSSYARLIPDQQWKNYSLIFLSDERHIEVNSCHM